MATPADIKTLALGRATELGFALAGVAPAAPSKHSRAFRSWLAGGRHASMDYLARDPHRRCDVRANWPWARSVLCLAASYAPAADADGPVARYARGRDYHKALKRLCHALADELVAASPGLTCRTCVDTAPVLERELAARAGLGWIGKNACLIHPTLGSYLLLAEIVLSVKLPPDKPMAGRCGDCRACLDACPNGAIVEPRVIDARRCNSWATVENRGELDGDSLDLRGQVFGCDICQRVCPFNRDLPAGLEAIAHPRSVLPTDAVAVLDWSADQWDRRTRGSAMRRATFEMLSRNAAIVAGQTNRTDAADALRRLAASPDSIAAAAARWALGQLEEPAR